MLLIYNSGAAKVLMSAPEIALNSLLEQALELSELGAESVRGMLKEAEGGKIALHATTLCRATTSGERGGRVRDESQGSHVRRALTEIRGLDSDAAISRDAVGGSEHLLASAG